MILISRAQLDALAVHARRHFEERVLDHLRRHFPALFAALGDDEMRVVVEEGARRANDHGLLSEHDLCRYLELMCVLGWDFDEDHTWAAEILASGGGMDALWTAAAPHLGAVGDRLAEPPFGGSRAGDPCAAPRNPRRE